MKKTWNAPTITHLDTSMTKGGDGSSYAESVKGDYLGDLLDYQNGKADPNDLPYVRDHFDSFRFRSTTVFS